jgi:hypothetical protein
MFDMTRFAPSVLEICVLVLTASITAFMLPATNILS